MDVVLDINGVEIPWTIEVIATSVIVVAQGKVPEDRLAAHLRDHARG